MGPGVPRYRLVPLGARGNPDLPWRDDRHERLAALCDAYGGPSPSEVLAILPRRLLELAEISPPAHAELYRRDASERE